MNRQDKDTYIAEEAFMVLHSGEIPEVTFHSSLYYLTEDPEGPGLELDGDDVCSLRQSVVERYRAIILRDLDPENRDKSLYRGLARCTANWLRLEKFCSREDMNFLAIRIETAKALREFLKQEVADVKGEKRPSCINCSHKEIEALVESLGISSQELPEGWQELCPLEVE